MKRIYSSPNPAEISIITALLKAHEIPAEVRGMNVGGAFEGGQSEIWTRPEDAERALYLIKHGEAPDEEEHDDAGVWPPSGRASARAESGARSNVALNRASLILNGVLIVLVLIFGFSFRKADRELSRYTGAELVRSVYDERSDCSTDRWRANERLAARYCFDADTGIVRRGESFSVDGRRTNLWFDSNVNGMAEYARSYTPEGAIFDEWIDFDDDGFPDRQYVYENGRPTIERRFRDVPESFSLGAYRAFE